MDDVTIPDGTVVTAGSTFVKTWKVKTLAPPPGPKITS